MSVSFATSTHMGDEQMRVAVYEKNETQKHPSIG